ncbi:DUF721 domain-containing protein [Candidatus Dependentiae bacterium]|nr:DUF721 domain-containing protein [Candidatus Dependentiae bacterium]
MIHSIKSILHSFFDTHNTWKSQLLEEWPSIIGDLKGQVQLEKINDDNLILGVRDSSWMQELYFLSDVLLKTINNKLDQPRIKKIRFKTMSHNQCTKKNIPKKKLEACKVVTLSQKEQLALEKIGDAQLRIALELFLVRCYQEQE